MSEGTITGAWSWRRSVLASDLPATTKHVLLTLSCYVPEMGDAAWPSLSTLAAATGLTRDTVKDHLASVAGTWVRKVSRHTETGRQTSNAWVLMQPADTREGVSETPGGGGGETPPPGGAANPPPRKAQKKSTKQLDLVSSEADAEKSERKRPARLMTEDWVPTKKHDELGAELGFNPDEVTEEADNFRDHFIGKGEARANWDASFNNWLRNAKRRFNGKRGGKRGPAVTIVNGKRILHQ